MHPRQLYFFALISRYSDESLHNVGSGVALICKSDLKPGVINMVRFPFLECITVPLKLPQPLIVSVIYRPPNLNVTFLENFTDYLSRVVNLNLPAYMNYW